jgi:hypothetical protein
MDSATIAGETDPARYYPPDVNRALVTRLPPSMKINLAAMLGGAPPAETR